MPIYEYRCTDCKQTFEELRSIKDSDAYIACAHCQSPNTIRIQSTCFSNVAGKSSAASSSHGCGNCHGGSCSSCSH